MSREFILQAPINSHRVRMVSIAQLGGSIYFGLLTTADTGGWKFGFMSDSGWSLGILLDRAARGAMARRVWQPRLGFDAGSVRVFNHGDEDYTLALMMPAWFVQSVLACGPHLDRPTLDSSTSSLDTTRLPPDNLRFMRVLAFMNQKGGVGKTTTAVNVGAALAKLGKSVCMIDVDPQAHLTINYGIEPAAEQPSLYDVLVNDMPLMQAAHIVSDRVAVVPSDIDLAGAEIELVSTIGRELVLKKRIAAAAQMLEREPFDYVILDCPPSLGLLTINALAAADSVIIPMQPHFLALQGMAKLLETVQLVQKRMNPEIESRRRGSDDVRRAGQAQPRSDFRTAKLHRAKRHARRALGRREGVRDTHPPQHQAGRIAELRPADLRL